MRFSVPDQLNYFQVTTFVAKESETLQWIDQLNGDNFLQERVILTLNSLCDIEDKIAR